jgi:hypothetical protein
LQQHGERDSIRVQRALGLDERADHTVASRVASPAQVGRRNEYDLDRDAPKTYAYKILAENKMRSLGYVK